MGRFARRVCRRYEAAKDNDLDHVEPIWQLNFCLVHPRKRPQSVRSGSGSGLAAPDGPACRRDFRLTAVAVANAVGGQSKFDLTWARCTRSPCLRVTITTITPRLPTGGTARRYRDRRRWHYARQTGSATALNGAVCGTTGFDRPVPQHCHHAAETARPVRTLIRLAR